MNSKGALALFLGVSVLLAIPSVGQASDQDRNLGKGRDADIYLPVPQPEIDLKTDQVQTSMRRGLNFEVGVSNWAPSGYSDASDANQTSNYTSNGGIPMLTINGWNAGMAWNYDWLNVAPKFGLSYDQLQRSGTIGLLNSSTVDTQSVNLYAARAGFEFSSNRGDFFGHLHPYLDVSLLPVWALASASALDSSGSSRGYFNVEEVAGLAWNFPSFATSIGAQGFAIELGIEGVQGVAGSPLSGYGILAGTRIEL